MQTVTVALFSGLQAMVGSKTLDLDLPDRATVAVLRGRVVEQYPVLEPFMNTLVCAVGEEIVPPEHVIVPGERIELIPPIAGGA
jgi:molybdopterin converting factor small subunit